MRNGVTLIELILVVALLTIIAAISIPFTSNMLSKTDTNSSAEIIISAIRKAQTYSMHKKNGSVWGVCKTENVIRVYRGNCTSPTQKEDTTITSSITINGLTDTTFSAVRGEPSAPLSITLTSSINSSTITVNQAGGLTIL